MMLVHPMNKDEESDISQCDIVRGPDDLFLSRRTSKRSK